MICATGIAVFVTSPRSENIEYCIEPKFDGASISLIYENDMLQRGATRGNGVAGDDITTNIKQIRSVPLSAKFSDYGIQQIEIRGEVLINKDNFKKFNEQLIEPEPATTGQSTQCSCRHASYQRPEGSRQAQPGSFLISCQLLSLPRRPINWMHRCIRIAATWKCYGTWVSAVQ